CVRDELGSGLGFW
nr:immunoglobulin heavy chain junction region [Macaca mulatta]